MYKKCPVCRDFMNRKNFGTKSGVIYDSCKSHGIWLDGGELKRLLKWKKAGGQLLHEERRQEERIREEKREALRKERLKSYLGVSAHSDHERDFFTGERRRSNDDLITLERVGRFLGGLFS